MSHLLREALNGTSLDTFPFPLLPRDYIPYVFSNAEMKRIFSVIDSRESAYDRYDSRLFYQTLIRLLYCTGLRLDIDIFIALAFQEFRKLPDIAFSVMSCRL